MFSSQRIWVIQLQSLPEPSAGREGFVDRASYRDDNYTDDINDSTDKYR